MLKCTLIFNFTFFLVEFHCNCSSNPPSVFLTASTRAAGRFEHLHKVTFDNMTMYMNKKQQRLEEQQQKRKMDQGNNCKKARKEVLGTVMAFSSTWIDCFVFSIYFTAFGWAVMINVNHMESFWVWQIFDMPYTFIRINQNKLWFEKYMTFLGANTWILEYSVPS